MSELRFTWHGRAYKVDWYRVIDPRDNAIIGGIRLPDGTILHPVFCQTTRGIQTDPLRLCGLQESKVAVNHRAIDAVSADD